MKEFARLGYGSIIITSDSNQLARVPELDQPYLKQEVDGIELWWIRTLKYQVAKSTRRILSWIDFEWRLLLMPKAALQRPDVIVVSSLSLLTVLNGFWLRKKYGCRLVFEVRDIWPLTITEEGGFSVRNPFVIGLAMIERLGYRHADAIVGTMPNLGPHVKEVLGYEKSVACVPMGVDELMLTEARTLPEEYVDQYLPKDKFIVAHVGSIGIANALEAFFKSAQSLVGNNEVHFLVIGDGDLREHYQKKYAHLSNLTFAPKVEKQMVQAVLAKCDLLYFSVHVSKVWEYGQSLNKVIDYMLSGKPILGSYTGFPSMINEAACGRFVAAGDVSELRSAILDFMKVPKLERETIGFRGKEWILKNRNYKSLAIKYINVLFPN